MTGSRPGAQSVVVRDAAATDLERITDIFNQAIPVGNAEWTESLHTVDERRGWWEQRRARGFPVVVAELGNVDGAAVNSAGSLTAQSGVAGSFTARSGVAGVASYGDFRDSTSREGYRFTVEHSVYVDENARSRGVARALMDELVTRATEAGVRQMVATIDATNPESLRFHSRYGFFETGRLPDIGYTFGTWRTLVIMQLSLPRAS